MSSLDVDDVAAMPPDIVVLLQTKDPGATLVRRHLWLIALMQWVRGPRQNAFEATLRIELFLDALDALLAISLCVDARRPVELNRPSIS
jgi:hypothetical protein